MSIQVTAELVAMARREGMLEAAETAKNLYAALTEMVASSDAYDETDATEKRCHAAIAAARIAIAEAANTP